MHKRLSYLKRNKKILFFIFLVTLFQYQILVKVYTNKIQYTVASMYLKFKQKLITLKNFLVFPPHLTSTSGQGL